MTDETRPGADTDPGADADFTDTPPVRLRDGVRDALTVFLAVRVGFSLLGLLAVGLIAPREAPPVVPGWPIEPPRFEWSAIVTASERQDAARFLAIATHGYRPDDGSAAFFPVYPALINAADRLPALGPLGAALLVSNAAFAGALILLHGLTRLEGFSTQAARLTVILVAIFPTGFFFLAPYSEGPFLLASVAAFWFARRDRWGLAALAGALAAATRSIGVVLVIALGVEAVMRSRADGKPLAPRLASAAAVIAGPARYLAGWHVRFGNALAPWTAQQSWQREVRPPWQTIGDAFTAAWRYGGYWLVDVVVVAVVVAAVAAGLRRLRASYSTYAVMSLAVPLVYAWPTRPLLSMPRFVVVIFPAFWIVARAVERRRLPEPLVVAGFAAGYALLGALFVTWWDVF
ncbi:MAG TPA: mannosyltransferase family protein [Actinomycetota bacterium]|nr:mannosyltransferase family protein [Actinomycetota bacterium]